MKILIAEDEKISRMTLKRILETEGYDVLIAEDGQEGWDIFEKEKDDIYFAILDRLMPRMGGLELCKKIKSASLFHYIYVMFLTGKRDAESIVEGFETGADDYLVKPFDRKELISRIKVGIRIIELEKALKEANKRLHILAIMDGLTGILNRRALFERLKEELSKSLRENTPFCTIMLDIDHFKRINDTFGHGAGDNVLIEIVARIRSELRPYDIIGRYGGEEFLIGTPGTDPETARQIAERLRLAIEKKPFKIDGKRLNVSISLGVASIALSSDGGRNNFLEAMINRADNALYKAKERGRNRVVMDE